ncbi:MAG: GNAT family N-acetyltransferase [Phycisphaerales bacterium]|nr:GNAT family N-acetyltransferase [Phycisphaerales bacterium]
MPWTIQPLSPSHDLSSFDCGEASLNSFLQRHALRNDRSGLGRTFVAVLPHDLRVQGYFTISTGSIQFDTIPDHTRKQLPKYPIPTAHLGRLAVDLQAQGQGLGEALLIEALRKIATASTFVGVYAIDVFALHDRAAKFYLKFGFTPMLDNPHHLLLPIQTAILLAASMEH